MRPTPSALTRPRCQDGHEPRVSAMILDEVFQRFAEESPVSFVVARAALEKASTPSAAGALFEEGAEPSGGIGAEKGSGANGTRLGTSVHSNTERPYTDFRPESGGHPLLTSCHSGQGRKRGKGRKIGKGERGQDPMFLHGNILLITIILIAFASGCTLESDDAQATRLGAGRDRRTTGRDAGRAHQPDPSAGVPDSARAVGTPKVTESQAVEIALNLTIGGRRLPPKGTPIEVGLKGGVYTVTFVRIGPPGDAGGHLGKILIDADTGKILGVEISVD